MEALLLSQKIIAEAIKKILRNFKKDSKDRKTESYLKTRIDDLNNMWEQFIQNHKKLLRFDDRSDDYFTSNAYSKVQSEYKMTLDLLINFTPVTSEDRGVPSKTEELLKQQDSNFRALSRAIKNIDINFDQLAERWEIEDKLQTLQSRWKTVDDVHWQIDSLLPGTNVAYEQEFAQHEIEFEATKRKLNQKLNASAHQFHAVPQIEIPTFSGNYNQWPTFMDLYSEAIHNNNMLTKAQKMQHLKGKLRGEAERIVQHLTVSADNYDSCWEILTHRYNNLQLLFTKQMQVFMNQPTIQQQSASELKRLHDTSLETIHAIHNLGIDTSTWDPILVHILTGKLDTETYTSYMESRKTPRDLPVFDDLITFLEGKFTALEPVNNKKQTAPPVKQNKEISYTSQQIMRNSRPDHYKRFSHKSYSATTERNCPVCKLNHILIYCETYQGMSTDMKLKTMSQMNICINCLYSHNGNKCTSNKRCRVCSKAHHTMLHDMIRDTARPSKETPVLSVAVPNNNKPPPSQNVNHVAENFNEVLLATAQLKIRAADGTYIVLRCLIDQGSQINLITEAAAQRLGLQRYRQTATVSGIGAWSNKSNGIVQLVCESLNGDYTFTTEALVMTKMLNNLPNYSFEKQQWPHLHGICLADPDYNISQHVDVLLDAQIYSDIVMEGILRGPVNSPIAQQTRIGWVLLGNVKTFNCHALVHNIDEISQFWLTEKVTEPSHDATVEKEYCETLHKITTRVCIQEEDQHLQKIGWRDTITRPTKKHQLCTITYGTKAAPLVIDDGDKYPPAANISNNQLYAGDLLGGSNNLTEAKRAQEQLINMLEGGRFNLRSWASNDPQLIEKPKHLRSQNLLDFEHAETNTTLAQSKNILCLGITWNSQPDQFTLKHAPLSMTQDDVITKRALLSELSQLYDPLGWLSPVTMKARIIFQQAWTPGIQRDDQGSAKVQRDWETFKHDLPQRHKIAFPRSMITIQLPIKFCGVCDASEKGYAGVIDCKPTYPKTNFSVNKLKAGKINRAPLKKPFKLPRLELGAALLLSRLMHKVIDFINVQTVDMYGWIDSVGVLWLQGEIAADCVGRGWMLSQVLTQSLWWTGPSWVDNNIFSKQETYTYNTSEDERKHIQVYLMQQIPTFMEECLQGISSMTRVTRALSWMHRLINNTREVMMVRRTVHLTTSELENVNRHLSTNTILSLNPKLDQLGILQVGRRLEQANMSQTQKHPIFLPNSDKLTELLVSQVRTLKTLLGEEDNTNKQKVQLRRRKSTNTFAIYLGIVLTFVTCVTPTMQQQLLNITSLNPAKLIYFDKMADLQMVQDEWKMVVYYNMSSYWQSLTNIENYITHLKSLCKDEVAFKSIASQFEHELHELRHYNDMLQSEHGTRARRGLVDGVGYIANSLFGILDERFADKYNKDIKLLQSNQNHLLNLYKEHTSLIEGEYNLLKRNEEVMNSQFSVISQHLKETENRVRENQQNAMYITASALAANMILSNLRRVQQLLIDLVTDVRNGRVDAHLLKPDEFEDQLNIISGQVPQELSLPCVNSYACIRQMYKLSRVHVRMTQNFLIFEVKIPLINSEQYELTRVIPIRNITGKTVTSVIPTTEYLAVNLRKDLMIPLSLNDLTLCVHFNEHQLLCTLNIPIYDIKTAAAICEAQIINNEAISSCRSTVLDCKDDWIMLHSQRSWLFTCCEECTVRIFCPAGVTSQALRNTGILTLADGCMLRGEHHVIHSRNRFRSEVKVNEDQLYTPESGINHFINTDNNFTLNPENHEEQLKALKEHIAHVKEQQETLTQQAEVAETHHYTMYGMATISTAMFGLWGILKMRRYLNKHKTRRQTTAPGEMETADDNASEHSRRVDGPSKPIWYTTRGLLGSTTTVDKATSPV